MLGRSCCCSRVRVPSPLRSLISARPHLLVPSRAAVSITYHYHGTLCLDLMPLHDTGARFMMTCFLLKLLCGVCARLTACNGTAEELSFFVELAVPFDHVVRNEFIQSNLLATRGEFSSVAHVVGA